MRKFLSIILLQFVFVCSAQKQDVQKSIETFFEGFHQKDSIKMKTVCSDSIILQSISEGDKGSKLFSESVNKFYKSIVSIPSDLKFQEKILSYNIQIDESMAHVWAPYEFYLNDKLSHSGVNTFTLFKDNGLWKIIYLIDTRRK
jgi:hypothetical protein